MPLSITVGLSRKASKDFQSTGVSINVTAELDQALLARPQELQQQIDALYHQAEAALDRQAGVAEPPSQREEPHRATPPRANDNGRYAGRSNGNGARSNGNGGAMTDSQRRAILAIADRLGLDAGQEIIDVFGWELDQLTLKQASQVIDHLKGNPAAARGR